MAWFARRLSPAELRRIIKDPRPRHIIAEEYGVHKETISRLIRLHIGVRKVQGEVKTINGRRVATPEHIAWQQMKNRCLNSRAQDYHYYGGRGIKVCERWKTFANFLADMGRRPSSFHTLDRKNVNGNYNKRNCRWATRKQQSQNRTDTRFSTKKVKKIRELYATGRYRQIDIARRYRTSQAAISQITRNAAWLES